MRSTLALGCVLIGCQGQGAPANDARTPQAALVDAPNHAAIVLPAVSTVAVLEPPPVAPSAPLDASADVTVAARLPWPLDELPLGDDASLGSFGARRGGFSKDDRYLGYEISTCDPCPSELIFVSPRAPAISMSYFYAPQLDPSISEKQREKHDADVNRRLTALGVGTFLDSRALRGPFPYPDLTFASKNERGADDSVSLLFGAHLPNEEPVYPIRIVIGAHPMRAVTLKDKDLLKLPPAEREKQLKSLLEAYTMSDPTLAYANVTKDGREIGVVALSSGTFWYEVGGVGRMQTATFVQKVRDETKKRHLTR